ncbi:MAG: porin family protein [Candidatus Brocadiaceae bacterium]|nr:porin family protein [Candidatus Brocadiaceae bacterium]
MKGKIVLLSCLFLVLLSTSVLADPQGKGFYLSGTAGAVWLSDADYEEAGDSSEVEYDPGFLLGAAAGYDFGMLRTEAEFAYRQNSFDKWKDITVGGVNYGDFSASGDVTTLSYLLNGYIDFENKSSITPYIGGGLGFANVDADDLTIAGVKLSDEDDTVFAYQAAAGIGYDINKKLTMDIGYRYFATSDPDFDGTDAEYDSHNVSFTVRYKLW